MPSVLGDPVQFVGWASLLAIGLWELYAPKVLDRDTALAPIVRDVPKQVEQVKEKQEEMRTEVDGLTDTIAEVQDRQKVQMQVQRAQARATDNMDEDRVDDYLVQNGVLVDTFLDDTDSEN